MPEAAEQAVIVTIKLTGSEFGEDSERELIRGLSSQLETALEEGHLGEYDGDEFGGGEATLYLYGPEADSIFDAVGPVLRDFPIRPIRVLRRYGDVSDKSAREEITEV